MAARAALVFLALLLLGAAGPEPAGVDWLPLDRGIARAKKNKKHVFLFFYTDWCGYCKLMTSTTLKVPEVIGELTKNFVSVKLNGESGDTLTWEGKKITNAELAMSAGIRGFPTFVFLDAQAKPIGNFASYADSTTMLKVLRHVSSGQQEKDIATRKP